MYARGEIVSCVECRAVVPRTHALELRDGYFACGGYCARDHDLRLQRRREDAIDDYVYRKQGGDNED